MQISSRFTIAIQIFGCIATFKDKERITSDFLASSIEVNPVIVRKILTQLKAAGLVTVSRGSQGQTSSSRALSDVTLLDIYRAVESVKDGKLFRFHEHPNQACPVGRNIHQAVDDKLDRIQQAMEKEMQAITLAEVVQDLGTAISEEDQ